MTCLRHRSPPYSRGLRRPPPAGAIERVVDQFREQLWAQILLERGVVPRAALEQFVHQRDAFQRQGRACTLGQLLMEQRHLSPQHYTEVHQEVERRLAGNSGSGRMTPSTGHFRGTGPVDDTGRFRMATPGTALPPMRVSIASAWLMGTP